MPTSDLPKLDITHWLVESGIQCQTGPDRGGIYGWIDEKTNRGSYLYTESSGYLLTLLRNLSALNSQLVNNDIVTAVADWIVTVAMTSDGAVLTRKYPGGEGGDDPFEFSCGIALLFDSCIAGYGLINAYRMTGNRSYAEAAQTIAERCLASFFDSDLYLRNVMFDTFSGAVVPSASSWSRQCGSFNLKTAMLFAELDYLSDGTKFRRAIDGLIKNALDRQEADGRFVTCDKTRNTHLHPHCYTVEGLLFLSRRQSRRELLVRALDGIDFVFRNCLERDMTLSQSWPHADHYCGARLRSDVVAQVLRLYYLAKLIDPDLTFECEINLPALHDLMDSFVLESGGTSYGFDEDGALIQHSNSWCQFFRVEMELFRYCHDQDLGLPTGDIVIT